MSLSMFAFVIAPICLMGVGSAVAALYLWRTRDAAEAIVQVIEKRDQPDREAVHTTANDVVEQDSWPAKNVVWSPDFGNAGFAAAYFGAETHVGPFRLEIGPMAAAALNPTTPQFAEEVSQEPETDRPNPADRPAKVAAETGAPLRVFISSAVRTELSERADLREALIAQLRAMPKEPLFAEKFHEAQERRPQEVLVTIFCGWVDKK